ncbi:restriction endonuclease subunit S, partial [Clostridium perfringens]
KLKCKIHSIESQKKIVKILDKSQELIDKRKKQIEKLDLLVKSKFIEMFGDPFNDEKGYGIKKLGEVTEVNPKKSEIKELDKDLIVSFVPMDRVSEKGEFAPELSKPISEVYNGFTYFKDNDVLFAKITPCMENGKGAIAINLSNGIGFGSTEFHVLRPIKDNSNPYWIYHLTTLIEFRRLAERKMTGSAGQKRVPTDFLNNVEVVIPPIELQNQFADFAKQVDKLKFELEKSLKELEDNFNSLMQKAFKGELFN